MGHYFLDIQDYDSECGGCLGSEGSAEDSMLLHLANIIYIILELIQDLDKNWTWNYFFPLLIMVISVHG